MLRGCRAKGYDPPVCPHKPECINTTATESLSVGITTQTREKVAETIQQHGLGLGMTVPEIREHYPAKAVRRTSVLEALRDLEAMGRIHWRNDRVCWVGPFTVDRIYGEPVRQIERDKEATAQERGSIVAELSNALVRRSPD